MSDVLQTDQISRRILEKLYSLDSDINGLDLLKRKISYLTWSHEKSYECFCRIDSRFYIPRLIVYSLNKIVFIVCMKKINNYMYIYIWLFKQYMNYVLCCYN